MTSRHVLQRPVIPKLYRCCGLSGTIIHLNFVSSHAVRYVQIAYGGSFLFGRNMCIESRCQACGDDLPCQEFLM